VIHIRPDFQQLFDQLGLTEESIFTHPKIAVWRKLSDRENCVLDATFADGRAVRLHIKRYFKRARRQLPVEDELKGYNLLLEHQIPTGVMAAHGTLPDRRSFVIFEDLSGYTPADKLLEAGTPFESILTCTAELAAKLHSANLHHRDLYLCHFMIKPGEKSNTFDTRLIDTARVGELPRFLTRQRWIVKDLAEFLYSTLKHPITQVQRDAWLQHYATCRGMSPIDVLRKSIQRKITWIQRHDERLKKKQPKRNVSVPEKAV
jgi:hypothetical protein